MQLRRLPAEAPPSAPDALPAELVALPGFRLVEEDDVAFALGLCREVHRIYGDYQERGLPRTDEAVAGLTVALEAMAKLSASVRDGMPAMRLTVAAAQTREMLAVTFGIDPLSTPLERSFMLRYRALVAAGGRALAALDVAAADDADGGEGDAGGPPASSAVRRRRWFRLRRRPR